MSALQGSLVRNPLDIHGIRQLAGLSRIVMGDTPTPGEIQRLFDAWGSSAKFAENVAGLKMLFETTDGIPDQNVLDLLNATGSLERQPLRTVFGPVNTPIQPLALVPGATTNWMQRRITEMHLQSEQGLVMPRTVLGLASTGRLCDSPTEVNHKLVQELRRTLPDQRTPTEAEMLKKLFNDRVKVQRKAVETYRSTKLEGLLQAFALWLLGTSDYPTDVYVPLNANALFVVLKVRRVLRDVWGPDFDAPDGRHKLYFSQDSCRLATNSKQLADAAQYQDPMTMFSGLVRLVHEMYLLLQEPA